MPDGTFRATSPLRFRGCRIHGWEPCWPFLERNEHGSMVPVAEHVFCTLCGHPVAAVTWTYRLESFFGEDGGARIDRPSTA